jgi:hypothetical protein
LTNKRKYWSLLGTAKFSLSEVFTKIASLCGEINGSLDEKSAEYIRNLLMKGVATIEKTQSLLFRDNILPASYNRNIA